MATPTSPLDLYEPLDIIGNGSFGVIRKVRRKVDGVMLACKELNFERMTDRDRKQIVAEVNILKDLHHDNIVRYMDRYVDRERGILYILMEYCGGGDLGGIIKGCQKSGRQLPEETIWDYMLQILHALQYCHAPESRRESTMVNGLPVTNVDKRHQILHRDIKPENVFLDSDHNLKLGDFGLSKALSAASTFANTYVGTPYYMSPELIQEKAYDTKSDIWSLGCLIYELCAFKPPFHAAQTHQELATFIRNGRIPPLPRGYSQGLNSVIKSMLNINPALRPSAHQLLHSERLGLAQHTLDNRLEARRLQSARQEVTEREIAVTKREQALQLHDAAREAEIRVMIEKKDAEVTEKETQLRAAFIQWEREVQIAQQQKEHETKEKDEALRVEILAWQQQIKTQWDLKENEFKQQILRLQELCSQREQELDQQRQECDQLKATVPVKKPFTNVQNTFDARHTIATPVSIANETPRVLDTTSHGRPKGRFRTPLSFVMKSHSKHQSDPGSAMKGVVLTSTGEILDTPTSDTLLDLLDNSPVRGFKGFGALKDELSSESEQSEDPPSSPDDERSASTYEESPSVPASRLRKPSIVKMSRPLFPSLATCHSSLPVEDKAPSLAEPSPSQSAPLQTPTTVDSLIPAVSATTISDCNEDDLPSPFLKRVERAARAGFKPASRRTSTETSKALRTAAAANAAGKAAISRPPSVASTSSRTVGRLSSAGRTSRSPDEMRRITAK